MDATQLLLSIMIFLLGVTLTVIGIQFYFILKELKKSVEKANIVLDDVHILSKNLADGSQQIHALASSFHELSGPITTGLAVLGLIKSITEKFAVRKSQKEPEDREEEVTP